VVPAKTHASQNDSAIEIRSHGKRNQTQSAGFADLVSEFLPTPLKVDCAVAAIPDSRVTDTVCPITKILRVSSESWKIQAVTNKLASVCANEQTGQRFESKLTSSSTKRRDRHAA
jgi:hypothetical protein